MSTLRYLLMVSIDHDLASAEATAPLKRQKLERMFAGSGSALFATETLWQPLLQPGSVLVGHAFPRDRDIGGARKSVQGVAAAIGADILDVAWGGYVALYRDAGTPCVLRDPSGLLPCYYAQRGGIFYFASDAGLLIDQGVVKASIDWSQLAYDLYCNDLPSERTSLTGIRQLLAGTAVELRRDGLTTRLRWSPWSFVRPENEPPAALRETIKFCVTNWRAAHGPVMLAVSGGLDSSIVAACLRGDTACRAITIATGDPHGDERIHARRLCSALNFDLTELRYDLNLVDIDRSSFAHLPRPGGRAQLQAYDRTVASTATRLAAPTLLTGLGGDNVFQFSRSARSLVDRYRTEGLRRGLMDTWIDVARLAGVSPWAALRAAMRVPRSGPKYRWRGDARFLASDIVDARSKKPLDHPWLREPADCLPGKAAHVAQLVRAQSYIDAQDPMLPIAMIHPLMSQPIVEACLAIPAWRACEGGVDRAQARRAFRDDLPTAILNRKQKGGPDGFAFQILRAHLGGIRERLLEGKLAEHGIIDRRAMETGLSEASLAQNDDYVRILLLLDTEAWVRGWTARPRTDATS